MKKVLVVLSSLNIGGAEARMTDVAEHLPRDKFQIDFLSMNLSESQFFEERLKACGVNIIKTSPPSGKRMLSHYKNLKKIMAEGQYNVVHANTSYHCGFVMAAAKKYKVPVRVSHSRTTSYGRRSIVNYIASFVGKFLIKTCATERLAISKDSGVFLFGKNAEFKVLPNAFDLNKYFSDTKVEEDALKQEFGLNDCFVVGNVGRFVPSKNQKFAVDILCEFLKVRPDAKLVFVGGGDTLERVKIYAEEKSVSEKVVFAGPRDDVFLWMKIFDVTVFPSEYEGLGNVAIESQAACTPCLCSGAVPKEVDMNLGLVEYMSLEKNASEWAASLESLSKTGRPPEDAIKNRFDEKNYTVESEVKQLIKIYES
ncbi:MAG: glycosyltransferase family 1 protein [Ruminococcaceae bacterium]|nr:glycosyltransferase family 1 protein [Oscillospiraceae bacterium]